MALFDQHDHSIVIRIVYDGPPEAGKTTSVRALARGFGREVYTPEEQDGRTVYFDWLEHIGGRFDGAPIRCQIASVPGQHKWRRRRLHFIDGADVVVFVADTSSAGWSESMAGFRRLLRRLRRREDGPVGVVFQANRRDVPDALPMAIVRERVAAENVAVIESVALDGSGVREAFVFAVRLALDRVREEQRLGRLPSGAPEPGGEDLLEQLRRLDREASPDDVAAERASDRSAPCTPSHELPSGLVWPPIEGRIVLREATLPGAHARRDGAGDYEAALTTGWRAHSAADAVYASIDEGRTKLVGWARLHTAAQSLLSRQRCIALAETGDGRWRLWQVVYSQPTLRDMLADDGDDVYRFARRLGSTSRVFAEAHASCTRDALALPCTLDTLGISDVGRPVFVGRVPEHANGGGDDDHERTLAHELAELVRSRPVEQLDVVRDALRRTAPDEFGPPGSRIRELLIEALEPETRSDTNAQITPRQDVAG